MSAQPTLITEEIFNYLIDNFSAEDEFLTKLKSDATAEKIPEICISPEQGRFLQFYLKSINAKYVLEIGSLAGYSAITMARALPEDGKVIALEIFKKNADFIREKAKEAGLEHKIEVINEDASKFLKDYKPDFEFDFVFIDADKKNYSKYMELTYPMVRKGGVICGDNALGFGHIAEKDPKSEPGNVKAIQAFNQNMKNHTGLFSCLVTMGDGMCMGIKL
ncbi:MAG: O-methyltransferase [Candidatus Kapaibacteriota bacterium]|jgi:caffeoyl-CoA O-methyltransferase